MQRSRSGRASNAVKLTYRIGFGSEQTLVMSDTGVGIYSATIPASAYSAGDMVRWYVTAGTSGGEMTREPPFPNETESAEYLGTVSLTLTLTLTSRCCTGSQRYPNPDRRVGTRASLFFKGRFYDNIFCRTRGAEHRQLAEAQIQVRLLPRRALFLERRRAGR
ncbi:MAG: hypothetical protein Ct9H300mP7_5340 [Verrucomicrobiota bacterium]|nr:MAG: hypothetical protein Ct9H300mP7_5340 [Verrucomicrobiota bacterium]